MRPVLGMGLSTSWGHQIPRNAAWERGFDVVREDSTLAAVLVIQAMTAHVETSHRQKRISDAWSLGAADIEFALDSLVLSVTASKLHLRRLVVMLERTWNYTSNLSL